RWVSSNDANAPARLPMGVRAEETITEPGMGTPRKSGRIQMDGTVAGHERSGREPGIPASSEAGPERPGAKHRERKSMSAAAEISAIRGAIVGGASGDELGALP